MNDGKYEEAISAFKALNGYSDSKNQITVCENAILESKYQAAIVLMNEGKYIDAAHEFNAIAGYRDSENQIYECAYCVASILLKNGEYTEAYTLFITLKGYKDVDSLLVNDENLSSVAREMKWQVGNNITFGSYPQNVAGNDNTPVEWLVLARDGTKALVISRYALDCVKYNTKDTDVTWATCSLRSWLNYDFYVKAFSTDEKKNIVCSKVTADRNPEYSTNPGNDTTDNVFLLSVQEVQKYFNDDSTRKCAPTDYAVERGLYRTSSQTVDGHACCWWWLRSTGVKNHDATNVNADGSVSYAGHGVDCSLDGVRPCLWVVIF